MVTKKLIFFPFFNIFYFIKFSRSSIICKFGFLVFANIYSINYRYYMISRVPFRITPYFLQHRVLSIYLTFFFKFSYNTYYRVFSIIYMTTWDSKSTFLRFFSSSY
mmetsp:Transcript_6878/g.620  ORF Transcript_6878/g.620 Transcript_6878/m.620 type:complete len:106 (-) Transcript_6878:142-459(-)